MIFSPQEKFNVFGEKIFTWNMKFVFFYKYIKPNAMTMTHVDVCLFVCLFGWFYFTAYQPFSRHLTPN